MDSSWCATRSTSERPTNRRQASGRLGGLGAEAGPGDVGGVVDRSRWSASHHTVLSTAVDTEQLVDFANLLGVELLIIDGSTNRHDFADRICWNRRPTAFAQGF
jgi:L-arabinose isomerase C-terminal domain